MKWIIIIDQLRLTDIFAQILIGIPIYSQQQALILSIGVQNIQDIQIYKAARNHMLWIYCLNSECTSVHI